MQLDIDFFIVCMAPNSLMSGGISTAIFLKEHDFMY